MTTLLYLIQRPCSKTPQIMDMPMGILKSASSINSLISGFSEKKLPGCGTSGGEGKKKGR